MICRTRKEFLDARPRQAFISYAQVEASWKTQLIKALKPLKSAVGLEIWHDGMLRPGDPWHPKILSALTDADLVILLVSRAFLESRYARETEIPLAVERADAGRSRLVPIILDSCDWAKQPFAKYQALPSDRVPIAERSDIAYALNDCLERLRWVFDPAEARYGGGTGVKRVRELPLLRVTFNFMAPNWPDWSALTECARKIADNCDVRTNAARRITGAFPADRWEWLLEGPQRAFAAVETAHQERRLAGALGVEVVSVDRTVGAVYYAGTYLTNDGEAPPPVERTLTAGSPMSPPVLFGLAVRPSEPDYLQPFCTKSGNDIGYDDWQREKQKLLGYFYTVLALPDDLHVNTGNHFAPLRQVHYAVALAKWYREEIAAHGFHTRLMELAEQMRTSLGNAAEIGPGPGAPEWMNECYTRYLELLDGVFRVVQPKPDLEGTNRLRVYCSGCVSFRGNEFAQTLAPTTAPSDAHRLMKTKGGLTHPRPPFDLRPIPSWTRYLASLLRRPPWG